MSNDVTTHDAMAAAALARNIQDMDASVDLHSATGGRGTSYEDPARSLGLRHALVDGFPSRLLHQQIVTTSVAVSESAPEGR
ncbi:hypothetical protein [uncultured Paludibaculum sp.]|uniref:hypothetical protein n=1 Tax=uncultured Paludibaculum sp. TaxID=1765020 RepID=UPI002AAAEF3A|nr:hypothetical protein [uncultured Paludibaculum sp.]